MRYTEGGYKRANKYACPHNSMKLQACNECKDLKFCLDRYVGAIASPIVGFGGYSEHEEDFMFETPVDVTVDGWSNLLGSQFLQSVNCHEVDGKNCSYEFEVLVNGSEVDGEFTLTHIGQTTVGYWILEDGTQLPNERTCEKKNVCLFQSNVNGAVAPLTVDGETFPLATGTYVYTAGDDTANEAAAVALAADATAAFDASGLEYQEITATVDDCDMVLKLNVRVCGTLDATLGKKAFLKCECCQEFVFETVEEEGAAEEKTEAPKVEEIVASTSRRSRKSKEDNVG